MWRVARQREVALAPRHLLCATALSSARSCAPGTANRSRRARLHSAGSIQFLGSRADEMACTDGWTAINGRCYKIVLNSYSLRECIDLCSPGLPACIHSEAEWRGIWDYILPGFDFGRNQPDLEVDRLWLGLYRPTSNSEFTCISGPTPDYTKWNTGAAGGDFPRTDDTVSSGVISSFADEVLGTEFMAGAHDCVKSVTILDKNREGYEAWTWYTETCDNQGFYGRHPCLCDDATNDALAAEAAVRLELWREHDMAFRRQAVRTMFVSTTFIWLLPCIILGLCCVVLPRVRRRLLARGLNSDGEAAASAVPMSQTMREQTKTLRTASRKAAAMRLRIKSSILIIGWGLMIFAWGPIFYAGPLNPDCTSRCLPGPVGGPFNWWLALFPVGAVVMLLALFPTEVVAIRVICGVFFGVYLIVVLFMGAGSIQSLAQVVSSEAMVYGIIAFISLCCAVSLTPTLLCQGCCPNDQWYVQPRLALQRVWLSLRILILGFGWGLSIFTWTGLPRYKDPGAKLANSYIETGVIIQLAVNTLCAVFATPRNRGRFHRFLGSLGRSESSEQEAATIAALIGGGEPDKTLAMGSARFRSLDPARLSASDLDSNSDKEGRLFAMTERATLGEVDCFLSHSWADEGNAKHEKLQTWMEERRAEGNAANNATVWLDSASAPRTRDHAATLREAAQLTLCLCRPRSSRGLHRPDRHLGKPRGSTYLPLRVQGARGPRRRDMAYAPLVLHRSLHVSQNGWHARTHPHLRAGRF